MFAQIRKKPLRSHPRKPQKFVKNLWRNFLKDFRKEFNKKIFGKTSGRNPGRNSEHFSKLPGGTLVANPLKSLDGIFKSIWETSRKIQKKTPPTSRKKKVVKFKEGLREKSREQVRKRLRREKTPVEIQGWTLYFMKIFWRNSVRNLARKESCKIPVKKFRWNRSEFGNSGKF